MLRTMTKVWRMHGGGLWGGETTEIDVCFYEISDGLTDCEDPECCGTAQCDKSQLCVAAKKPIDILLRKQPPAITASFFEKMRFLIEEGSLQSYARQDAFNGR